MGGARPFFRGRGPVKKEAEHKINDLIRATQVRLVGDNVTPNVYTREEALSIAKEQGLDLVEVVPNAEPPVCRIVEYQKFLYDKKKKDKEW